MQNAATPTQSVEYADTVTNDDDSDRTLFQQTNSEVKSLDDEIRDKVSAALHELLSDVQRSEDNEVSLEEFAEVRFMDFAGQKDYYATHQVFLSPYVLYLLVSDINKDIKSVTEQGLKFDDIAGMYF